MMLSRRKSCFFFLLLCCCAFFTYIFIVHNPSYVNFINIKTLNAISDDKLGGTLGVESESEVVHSLGFLPESVVNSVRKFVFFVGYARSGHSIIGSLLDAHPNVIIAHEYTLFEKWIHHPQEHCDRRWLYTALYNNSNYAYFHGLRKKKVTAKGYSLHVNASWQGQYNHTIAVIGDKAGGMTTKTYKTNLKNGRFVNAYYELLTTIKIPVVTIHALRNPFDNIATMMFYNDKNKKFKLKTTQENPYDNPVALEKQIVAYFSQVKSVTKMINDFELNVTEIHNADLVSDPKGTISRLCRTLEIRCTDEYLELCSKKVYDSLSKTRHLVKWTPAQRQQVEEGIQSYEFLHRYSFDD